ncbi:hypothetical protein DFH06DRAFT_1445012 [Mycena polygramma]|nr:hypothetical protein DFH06DRAFT_1445012 [Mycena polygramma]
MTKFTLTEAHVKTLVDPVSRSGDWASFLGEIDPNVRWVIASEIKDPLRMTGYMYVLVLVPRLLRPSTDWDWTKQNLASWTSEIGLPLRCLMVDGVVKMTVSSIDIVGNKAILEAQGEATTAKGRPYCNRYVWFLIFSEETGKIVEIREYLDTALVQEVNQAHLQ